MLGTRDSMTARERIFHVQAHIMNCGLYVPNWEELDSDYAMRGRYDLGGGRRAGLVNFPCAPKLEVRSKRRRTPPYDVEEVGFSTWFVSDRFKEFAEATDPGAFDFVECDNSRLVFKGEQLIFWACGIRRFGGYLDEANSENLKVREEAPGWRSIGPLYSTRIAVDRSKLGNAHVFGLEECRNHVFCDEHFMKAYKAAKFRPLTFNPV
jgi:hypothetical protein